MSKNHVPKYATERTGLKNVKWAQKVFSSHLTVIFPSSVCLWVEAAFQILKVKLWLGQDKIPEHPGGMSKTAVILQVIDLWLFTLHIMNVKVMFKMFVVFNILLSWIDWGDIFQES